MYFKRDYLTVRLNLSWALVVCWCLPYPGKTISTTYLLKRLYLESAREIELLGEINMEMHILRIQVLGFLRPRLTILSVLEQVHMCVLPEASTHVALRAV